MFTAILLLPLLGCLIAGLFARQVGEKAAQIIPSALLVITAFLSWTAFGVIQSGEALVRSIKSDHSLLF